MSVNNDASARRNSRLPASERRRQILRKAHELCAKKGFAGTTLDEIARKAGVSRALLIQYFGSKEGIYEALIDYLFQNHPMEEDLDIQEYVKKRDDRGFFNAFGSHIFGHAIRDKAYSSLRLIFYSMLEKPDLYRRHCLRNRSKVLSLLEEYISVRIKEGAFRKVNPHHVAVAFLSVLTQLSIQELTIPQHDSNETMMNYLDTLYDVLMEGLRRK